jgi:hypothetical protein
MNAGEGVDVMTPAPEAIPARQSGGAVIAVSHPVGNAPRGWKSLLVAAGAYLALSLLIWWHVWSAHPTSTTTCGCGDPSLVTWFLAWPAHAIAHGLNPLYTTAMNYPHGVNLLSNASSLAVGVILAPVTWAFGPIASLNVALVLSPVLSALAMFILLRRWVAWPAAAFIGGLLYGFSPFMLTSLSNAWLMLGLGVVPPLLIACLDDLLIRQRGRPVVKGCLLGLLITLQFFIGDEVLLIMAIGLGLGVIAVVVYAAARYPDILRQHLHHAVAGIAAAVVTAGVFLAYPVWFAFAGPASLTGNIWGPHSVVSYSGTTWGNFLLPAKSSTAATALIHRFGGYQGPRLSPQYFGIGLAVLLLLGCIAWYRDRRLWLFGGVGIISVWLSQGLQVHRWSLWRLLVRVPLLENIEPYRFVVLTFIAASIMLGLIVDHAYQSARRRLATDRDRSEQPGDRRHLAPRWSAAAIGLTVGVIALVGPAAYLAQSIPMTTQAVVVPNWFRTVAPHLRGHQVILTFPDSNALLSELTWQAVDGMHYDIVGTGGPSGTAIRAGKELGGLKVIAGISNSYPVAPKLTAFDIRQVKQALAEWGVTMVVIPDQRNLPAYERVRSVVSTAALITAATGKAPVHRADAWVWSAVTHADQSVLPSTPQFARCTEGSMSSTVAAVYAATRCVLLDGDLPTGRVAAVTRSAG